MNRIKILGLAALSVLALSSLAATAARAEGPFYRICEKIGPGEGEKRFSDNECTKKLVTGEFEKMRLAKGQKDAIEASTTKDFVLTSGPIKITCKKLKLENANIIGSTGANAGTSEETVVFEECSVEGNGEKCALVGSQVKTERVKNTLDKTNEKTVEGEQLLTLFQPVKDGVFVKLKFEGSSCTFKEAAVEGSVAAESLDEAEKPILLGTHEVLGEKSCVGFPATAIKVDWIEEEAKVREVKVRLAAFGKASVLTGTSCVKLTSKEHWGVFGR
jgi:hypothetical protein